MTALRLSSSTDSRRLPASDSSPAGSDAAGGGVPEPPEVLTNAGLATVLVGALLAILDFFIVNVALPTIGRDLHASGSTLEMVVTGYGLAYAVTLVVGGRLGDSLGRRRLFVMGMSAFTLLSLLCGLAPSAQALVAARIAQGIAAAMMVPQVLATIQATTTGERRARSIGLFGATAGVAAAAGQLLGGILLSANVLGSGWRPIFLVNVPVGIVGVIVARRSVPDTRSSSPAAVDGNGTFLLGTTLVCFLVPIMLGRVFGWPAWSWVMLAGSPLLAAAFVRAERRSELRGTTPLVPPSLVQVPSMRRGLSVVLPFFCGFGGFMFVYAVTLQEAAHLSPLDTGLALAPMAFAFLAASLVTARLVARYGRRVVTFGAALMGTGLAGVVLTTLVTWPHLTPGTLAASMTLAGTGQGLVMTPLFGIVLSEVPADRAGIGSGVLSTAMQTALALGVGTIGSLFLSLSRPGLMGPRNAFVVVLLIDVGVAAVVTAMSRRLPGATPTVAAEPVSIVTGPPAITGDHTDLDRGSAVRPLVYPGLTQEPAVAPAELDEMCS